jgi:hypothetical protein
MNVKRYFLASAVVFVFIFIFEWIFHGVILGNMYAQTSYLWRPKEEMSLFMPWMVMGQLLFAFVFTFIFLKGYENKGIAEGIRYGILIALLYVPSMLIEYSVIPYPFELIIVWIIGGFLELPLAGAILATLYKPKA